MKTGPALALMSTAVAALAVFGLLSFTTVKGNPAMSTKPLIDTHVPAALRTVTFAMG
jgi:hypothetical protein